MITYLPIAVEPKIVAAVVAARPAKAVDPDWRLEKRLMPDFDRFAAKKRKENEFNWPNHSLETMQTLVLIVLSMYITLKQGIA